jgi:hypothetical protein
MRLLSIIVVIIICLDAFYYIFFAHKEFKKDPIAQQIEAIDECFPLSDSLSLKYKSEAIKKLLDDSLKY